MHKITFDPKWLKAAAIIAARRDIRYYLNGVLVEVFSEEARLVATDGHRMAIFRKVCKSDAPVRLIVPTEIIDHLKPHRKFPSAEAELHYNADNPIDKATLQYLDIGIQFKPIDGKYPDYHRTLAESVKPSGEVGSFNPTYLADFKRCVETAFGVNRLYSPSLYHNGTKPAPVTYMSRDDFFGVVMPMHEYGSFAAPKWTLPVEEEKPEVALAA